MSEPVFLIKALPATDQATLDGPEGHHAADVQRLRVGEKLTLSDGSGHLADAEVTAVRKGELDLLLSHRRTIPAPNPRLIVAQALPKGDRGERATQMMTEIGVDEIIPWQSARSITQWKGPRGEKSRQKWVNVAREASKQARRATLPTIAEVHTTKQLVQRLREATQVLLLHEEATEPLSGVSLVGDGDIILIIGPEGSLTPEELAAFTQFGAPIRLGQTVLRTSTAGPAALSVLQSRLGRW
ncbi:16S rRNA (uracil(1498)-N(3))-methyltransferase [Natronoglycomyces albus]|uniref:Ribosomal RNA small subunit methyltransferase E n=1 Tax=Natronoglycomyces albus TaxID=2811108 RepID=A0A895XF50_9ACTN|nr:16S rRNA (uracil(1498)-N(3))-methyltransferase [Natronoglycomyces albus]QSB04471.1 16S rRNA (uracil(1498)-N(3))-methyltransferase [Natronoglycomyces albus]